MRVPNKSSSDKAFTRLELVVVLAVLGLLAAVTWPALAVSAGRSERVTCINNLRQIGRAFQMWGNDHGGQRPWRVPDGNGGLGPDPLSGTGYNPIGANCWYQFYFVQGVLVTPKILVCPSDSVLPQRRIARDWGAGPNGFVNTAYRNNAVSYFISLDAPPLVPQAAICGDRNVNYYGRQGACSAGPPNAWVISSFPPPVWTNSLHGVTGNLVLNDGGVLQTSSAGLSNATVPNWTGDNGLNHTVSP